jgi:predicted phage terminase large subunit-like protein
MQNPTAEEGAILKREWWQPWEDARLPELKHVIQSYDTAFSKKETADYSAITTWGVFTPFEDEKPALILLDALRGRYDFPELKMVAFDQYKYWDPETVIVEKKATGEPLIQEMRKMGVPVVDFVPVKGKDKVTRAHACAPLFESGQVFYPVDERWAEEVIEECAAFPYGENDDYVDSTTQAVLRYRKGNFVSLFSDEKDEPSNRRERPRYYFD